MGEGGRDRQVGGGGVAVGRWAVGGRDLRVGGRVCRDRRGGIRGARVERGAAFKAAFGAAVKPHSGRVCGKGPPAGAPQIDDEPATHSTTSPASSHGCPVQWTHITTTVSKCM